MSGQEGTGKETEKISEEFVCIVPETSVVCQVGGNSTHLLDKWANVKRESASHSNGTFPVLFIESPARSFLYNLFG